MNAKRSIWTALAVGGCLACAAWVAPAAQAQQSVADQLATIKTFDNLFMEQVKIGDALFHGDPATEKKMNVTLSTTGMACAMCHPFAADTHPAQYPKWQEQMSKFAALRDMINWCIEKPNQGQVIDVDGPAMKALEAYITWSNKNSPLAAGTH
jgi:thiosulfate dehydrogenase